MAGEWESASLSELCEQIADCPHSTPLWTDSGVIVLRNQNIRDGRLDLSSPSYTDELNFEQRSRRARLKAGDLVLTREAPMGEVCMVPENLRCCLGQRMVMLRPDPKKCDSRFLLYSIQSDAVQHEIKVNEGTGSTVSNLRIPLLEALPIPIPPLAEQKAIAGVLGALDDKIELNRRMNVTLESMARALFQSWFVDFDPVRAKLDGRQPTGMDKETAALFPDAFQESQLGPIPHGWRTTHVEEIASVGSGKRPEGRCGAFSPECNIPLYGGGGRMGYVPSALYDKPILFTGRVGTLGLIFRTSEPSWPSDNTLIIEPQADLFDFTYFVLKGLDLITLNRGSTQPLLTQSDLKRQTLVLPTKVVINAFANLSEPIFRQMLSNERESRTLATLRDTLLPKLLSGDVSVTETH
jgi:type I restriction enzyme S subunit